MKSSLTQVTTGVCITIVGALLLLDTAGLTNNALHLLWPSLLVIVGVVMLINDRKNYIWPGALIVGGALFQLRALDIISVNPWQFFWPVIIMLVGLSVLTNRNVRPRVSKEESEDVSAIFAGIDQVNAATDYKGGNVTAVMGGVKIDMRKAIIKKEATLNVFAFCGGIELIVPENVVVKPQATCIMGGIENKQATTATKDSPVLYITGTITLGGVEIKA